MRTVSADEPLRRYLTLVQDDVARQRSRFETRVRGGSLELDERRGELQLFVGAECTQRWEAEAIGLYHADTGTMRWGWVDRAPAAKAQRVDAIFRHGKSLNLQALSSNQVVGLDEHEGEQLAWATGLLVRSEGVWAREHAGGTQYFALFAGERTGNTSIPPKRSPAPAPTAKPATIPPPPLVPKATSRHSSLRPPAMRPASIPIEYASSHPPPDAHTTHVRIPKLSAITSIFPPVDPTPENKPVRLPSTAILEPVARAIGHQLRAQHPTYQRAVYVISAELAAGKLRYHISLVCSDQTGELHVLEASSELREATKKLLREDVADGNGRWARLIVHLSAVTAEEAGIRVEVKE